MSVYDFHILYVGIDIANNKLSNYTIEQLQYDIRLSNFK